MDAQTGSLTRCIYSYLGSPPRVELAVGVAD